MRPHEHHFKSFPTLQPSSIRARKAGFVSDVMSIAGRALRSVTRDTEFVLPALIIPVFFYFVNVGSLSNLTDAVAPGFDYKAFQLPSAIIFGVTGISRAGVVVTDVQDGYFDRLLLTPVRRLALLLGMMVADIVLVAALTVPVVLLGLITGVRFETGLAGIVALDPALRVLGARVHRVPVRDRAEDRQPRRGEHELHPVLPVRVPHDLVRAARSVVGMAGHRRGLEPGHLPARRDALADHGGLGLGRAREGRPRGGRSSARSA